MIGRTVTHYEILEVLGEGGVGVVYKARDLKLGRLVAIKFLSHELSGSGVERERFIREARATAALTHPNIAQVHEIDESDGRLFIVLEYVEGYTLEAKVGTLGRDEVVALGIQIAEGLAAAHARGIVHRDIKPSNIMVRDDGRVEITDFGLAHLPGLSRLTSAGASVGTISYMSPEQVRGNPPDPRSDVFSLGVVLYELATGTAPFGGANTAAVLYQIMNTEPPPMASLRPGSDAELEGIITRCLAKDPSARTSAAGVAAALRSLGASSSDAVSKAGPERPELRAFRPARWKLGLTGAALAVAGLVAVWIYTVRAGTIDSLAVLPFVSAGADTSAEYLSDGITETLIDKLSQLPKLKVIARGSVFQFKGGQVDPRDAGRKLHVRAVLTGAIAERDGRAVITVELVDVRDARHLWGQRYYRPMAELQNMQEQIAIEIASRIRYRLSGRERDRLARHDTESREAYELYMRGLHESNRQTESNARLAAGYFHRAIEIDSTFARAYAKLADTYSFLSATKSDPVADMQLARRAVERALAIDPDLAEARVALAQVLWEFDYDWSAAEREFKSTLRSHPGYEPAHTKYAYFLLAMDRVDEAEPHLIRARELDPISSYANLYLGAPAFYRKRYAEAGGIFRRVIDETPDAVYAHFWLGWSYAQLGQYDDAIGELRTLYDVEPNSVVLAELGRTYALAGKRDSTLAVLAVIERPFGGNRGSEFSVAKLHVALGDKDQAFRSLERAIEVHDSSIPWLKVDPDFEPLHGDPRYLALLRRLKLGG